MPLLIFFFFPLRGLILVPAGRSQLENTKYRERRGETEGRRMERWLNMCAEDKDVRGGEVNEKALNIASRNKTKDTK